MRLGYVTGDSGHHNVRCRPGTLYHRLPLACGLCETSGMTRRASLNVSLTRELIAFIAAQVGSGRYGSASEVVRTGLRLLEGKERQAPAPPRIGIPRKTAPDGR